MKQDDLRKYLFRIRDDISHRNKASISNTVLMSCGLGEIILVVDNSIGKSYAISTTPYALKQFIKTLGNNLIVELDYKLGQVHIEWVQS